MPDTIMTTPAATLTSSNTIDALFHKPLMTPPVTISPTVLLTPPEEQT